MPQRPTTTRSSRELLATARGSRTNGAALGVRGLLARAEQLAHLEPLLLAALPTDLAAHTRLAGVDQGTLALVADSPAWAARLRYQGRQLLAALRHRDGFRGVRRVKVTVARQRPVPGVAPRGPRAPSESTRQHLQDFAGTLPESPLRDVLAALADHTRR